MGLDVQSFHWTEQYLPERFILTFLSVSLALTCPFSKAPWAFHRSRQQYVQRSRPYDKDKYSHAYSSRHSLLDNSTLVLRLHCHQRNGCVATCLDECLELLLADESALRIFTSEAVSPDGLIVSQPWYRQNGW